MIGVWLSMTKTMTKNGLVLDAAFLHNGTNIAECSSYVCLGRGVAWGAYRSIEDVMKEIKNTLLCAISSTSRLHLTQEGWECQRSNRTLYRAVVLGATSYASEAEKSEFCLSSSVEDKATAIKARLSRSGGLDTWCMLTTTFRRESLAIKTTRDGQISLRDPWTRK